MPSHHSDYKRLHIELLGNIFVAQKHIYMMATFSLFNIVENCTSERWGSRSNIDPIFENGNNKKISVIISYLSNHYAQSTTLHPYINTANALCPRTIWQKLFWFNRWTNLTICYQLYLARYEIWYVFERQVQFVFVTVGHCFELSFPKRESKRRSKKVFLIRDIQN